MFPHEAVPDGAVMGPHHLYVGFMLLVVGIMTVWDDRPKDPVATILTALLTLFGFMFVWPFYAAVGAAMTLLGLALAPVAGYADRDVFREAKRTKTAVALAVSGWAIAVDDAVEHAFGVSTPLDTLWSEVVFPVVQMIEAAAA